MASSLVANIPGSEIIFLALKLAMNCLKYFRGQRNSRLVVKTDNWKTYNWPILAVYQRDFFCR